MTGRSDLSAHAGALVALAASRAPTGRTRVIGIDGRSGTGKTTLAELVADTIEKIAGPRPQILHLDSVYPGWDGLAATPPLVAAALADLATGGAGQVGTWDWGASRPGPPLVLAPGAWLVVEGVGCGAAPVRPHLAALAWLVARDDIRHERAIARDGDSYLPHWERWAAQERALLATDDIAGAADVVVRTDPGAPSRSRRPACSHRTWLPR